MSALPTLASLTAYQWAWARDPSRIRVGCWSRRSGKSTIACLDLTAEAVGVDLVKLAALPAARTSNGLIVSTNEEQARALLEGCRRWAVALGAVLGEDVIETASVERLRFRNGREIRAVAGGNPRSARGFGGRVLIDEAAHLLDPEETLRAVLPVAGPSFARPEGYRVDIISTPLGAAGPFWRYVEGDLRHVGSVHRVDVYDAARAGLIADVEALRAQTDPDTWSQEYAVAFASPSGALIPVDLVDAAVCGAREVPAEGQWAAGWDPARRRDQSAVVEVVRDAHGVAWVARVEQWRGAAWADQERAVGAVARRVSALAIDSAGVGSASAERLAREHGVVVEVPLNSSTVREQVLTGLVDAFRKGRVRVPEEFLELRRSLTSMRKEVTATGAIRIVIPRAKEGHGDAAVALALALHALGDAGWTTRQWQDFDDVMAAELPRSDGRGLDALMGTGRAWGGAGAPAWKAF